jgi:hypothetical protein
LISWEPLTARRSGKDGSFSVCTTKPGKSIDTRKTIDPVLSEFATPVMRSQLFEKCRRYQIRCPEAIDRKTGLH